MHAACAPRYAQLCNSSTAITSFAVSAKDRAVNEGAAALAQKRYAKHTKLAMTPAQKRRAAYERLLASLPVNQHTALAHTATAKQKPACGVFASV